MMGILHQSRGKGNAAARTLGETMSASRATKQLEDSAVIEQIHDISQRPQFSGLSGELGVASSQLPIQAKLTIGQPNDRYEQEADRVASQVVQQINAPASVQSSQRQSVQRTEAPEEEEIQAKLESTSLQRKGAEAITDLDTAINSARGGGQSLDAGLQRSMGQAMGADFSGVKVHTDAQSDQLNQLIQAKAFTTGQDVFFRQGAYEPGSRGGQELLAHELTHVVQQNAEAVQRSPFPPTQLSQHSATENPSASVGEGVIQVKGDTSSSVVQRVNYKGDKGKSLRKLRESYKRNRKKKARPCKLRHIFGKQQKSNYGYRERRIAKNIQDNGISNALTVFDPKLSSKINPSYSQIGVGDVSGYFRKGFGGQPFLYLNSEVYEDKMIPSNYDDIINYFKGKDAEIAKQMLEMIEVGGDVGKDKSGQAKSLFILLTQFIEAHNTRIPGVDKLARALLRRIALGQLTFQQAFNRQNGLFVSAWATKAKAPVGGQKAARALFGASKVADKYSFEKLESYLGASAMEKLLETIDVYYSDDSDMEDEEEEAEGSDDSDMEDEEEEAEGSEESVVDTQMVEKINRALKTLEIKKEIKSNSDIAGVAELAIEIEKQYKWLLKSYHPDKGGTVEKLTAIVTQGKFLQDIISRFVKKEFVDERAIQLQAQLQSNDLNRERIEGDGNCFYSAILDQILYLDGVKVEADTLRGQVAQLILDNANTLQVYVTGAQLNKIVNEILTSHSWANMGGDFAPQLIATVLNRPVKIIQPTGVITMNPRIDLNRNGLNMLAVGSSPITIIYNGVGHYDSTRSTLHEQRMIIYKKQGTTQ